jgi:hypothetical protein
MRVLVALSCIFMAALTGCGRGSGNVEIGTDAFSPNGGGASNMEMIALPSGSMAPSTPVTDFKVCIRGVRLENENDEVESGDDEENSDENGMIQLSPGLVDLTSGIPQSWGEAKIPTGFKLKRIKVKIQKHVQTCGVDYSVKFNNETINRDIEFRFRFDPPVEIEENDRINLSLAAVVTALRQAADDSNLKQMHQYIDAAEGSASIVKKQ